MAGIPNGPRGIDTSSHNPGLDWAKIKAAGIDFAFIKLSQGNYYVNELFASQWAGAKAQGILRGAYQFWRWDVDPLAQAQWFLSHLPAGDTGELPFVVDVEGPGEGPGTDGGGKKDYGLNEALLRVRAYIAAIKRATGKTPMIYTYPELWRTLMGDSKQFTDCPLWIASYGRDTPDLPGGWPTYTFWQYTSKGYVAGAGQVDCDVFNGTIDQLKALSNLDPATEYVSQTHQYVGGGFLPYWKDHAYLGYPLTGEFTQTLEDGNAYTVQLYERGLLHWAPGQQVGEARIGYMWGKLAGLLK